VIESLGVVDVRSGLLNESQIWPVGYRSTWHDSTTASFCISEIINNGTSIPVFRVTRKFCPTYRSLSSEAEGATGPGQRKDLHVSENILEKENTKLRKEESNTLPSRLPYSHIQGPKARLNTASEREDRESLNALLDGLGDMDSEQESLEEWELLQSRDAIGEFVVEGTSTLQAWKLFAEEFVGRCRKTPWVLDLLRDVCPHKSEGLACKTGALEARVVNQSTDSVLARLLAKLAEDRFGLSDTVVKSKIEGLANAGDCSGYKVFEQGGLYLKEEDPVPKPAPQSRFRAREKARKHRRAPEVVAEEQNAVMEHIKDAQRDEVSGVPLIAQRPPPPSGQPIARRLPPELVGDVLQVSSLSPFCPTALSFQSSIVTM
jgi:hypothetical protein